MIAGRFADAAAVLYFMWKLMIKDLIFAGLGLLIPGLLIYIFSLKSASSKKDGAIKDLVDALSGTRKESIEKITNSNASNSAESLAKELKAIDAMRTVPSSNAMLEAKELTKKICEESDEDLDDCEEEVVAESFFVTKEDAEDFGLDKAEEAALALPKDLQQLVSRQAKNMKELFKNETETSDSSNGARSFFNHGLHDSK